MSVRSDSCRAHCLTGGWASTKARCTDQDLDPLAAVRVDIERYVRWLVRTAKPARLTVR